MSEWIIAVRPGPNIRYTFDGVLLGRLEDQSVGVSKGQRQNMKFSPLSSGSLNKNKNKKNLYGLHNKVQTEHVVGEECSKMMARS